jgi:hypothetical protein
MYHIFQTLRLTKILDDTCMEKILTYLQTIKCRGISYSIFQNKLVFYGPENMVICIGGSGSW